MKQVAQRRCMRREQIHASYMHIWPCHTCCWCVSSLYTICRLIFSAAAFSNSIMSNGDATCFMLNIICCRVGTGILLSECQHGRCNSGRSYRQNHNKAAAAADRLLAGPGFHSALPGHCPLHHLVSAACSGGGFCKDSHCH